MNLEGFFSPYSELVTQSTSNNTRQTRALTPRFTFTDAYAESEHPVLKIGEKVSIVLGTAGSRLPDSVAG